MRDRRRMLVVTAASLFFSVLVWFNYSAVLPSVVDEWGLSGTEAGIIFGAFQAGYLVAIVPAGWFADRYSPRWVIAVGATGAGAPSLLFAGIADGFLVGTVLRFLSGLFMAGVYVPGMRFVTDWFPESTRGRALGLYIGAFSLGSGLSFVFSTAIADAISWRVAVAATSVGALFVSPFMLALTRDHPDRTGGGGAGFDLSVLRNREYLLTVSVYAWHNWELFGARNWLLAFLVAAPAFAAAESVLLPGFVVGSMIALGSVGNLTGGWLSDRIGRPRTIAIGLTASASLSLVFGLLGELPIGALVLIVLAYGVVITMDSAPTSTMVTEVVDDAHVGTALSVQSLVGFTTTVISPVVFGLVLDRSGYPLAFPTLAVGALLGLLSIGLLSAVRARRNDGGDQL